MSWSHNGYGWTRPVTSEHMIEEGWVSMQITQVTLGQKTLFNVKKSSMFASEIIALGCETLDDAKNAAREYEVDTSYKIWGQLIIGVCLFIGLLLWLSYVSVK